VTRALVVGAPASGSGKTTVATGLLAALRRRGTVVAPFKVGPDYIDPGYHTLAAGRPGRNLDPVLVGPDLIAPLARHGSVGAELAVIEGVMGLFVVLNRVGSDRHEAVLRAAADEVGLPVLGALPRRSELAVPSRHLGLVTAAEHGRAATAAVDAMADLVASHIDLDAVAALATPLPAGPAWSPAPDQLRRERTYDDQQGGSIITTSFSTGSGPVVAVFGGAAFTFGYAEHVEVLAAAGATVAVVDPLRDEALPAGTAALVLPGGFPEEHVPALAANEPLLDAVRAAVAGGAPVHAECGGLLYLCESLDGGTLCGVLPATATMTGRLTLGYRDAVALTPSPLFAAGTRVAGHEFHRCAVTPRAGVTPAWGWRGGEPEGFVHGRVHASFLHTHPAADPSAVTRFLAAATVRATPVPGP
jgi:cobyrinic acid a,c-diamide synthase